MVRLNFLMFLCVLVFSEDIVDQRICEILIESILEGKVRIRIFNDMKLTKTPYKLCLGHFELKLILKQVVNIL